MSLNRRQQIDYTQKYQILSGRVNYANYVIRNQKVNEGRLLGLNIYFPDNDASAVTLIQEGIVATTPEEVATYLGNINQTSIPPVPVPPTIPGAPTGLSAIPGNTEAIVSFTPGTDGSSPITNYEYWITNLSGSTFQEFSPPQVSSPVTITGLTNGIEYNIRLRAVNSVGPGIQSEIVNVTPATVPDAPTSVTASPGDTQASVSFTAPANNGGSSITSYTVTSSPGGFTATGASSSLIVTGLTNGTAYTFTVIATNSVGDSVASVASAPVTPAPPAPPGDAIVASLTTSLAAYDAAAIDDWVQITSTEYTNLQTNVTGTTRPGLTTTYLTGAVGTNASGLSQTSSALVANTVTALNLAIPANNYLYGFALKYTANIASAGILVYTNTNTASTGGFNQVGNTLPSISTAGVSYFVRKGVSTTNGATAGLLGFFTGTKMDYPGSFFGSAGYIGFNQFSSPTPPVMRYLLGSGGIPAANSSVSSAIPGYGAFQIQGLATPTKQWA